MDRMIDDEQTQRFADRVVGRVMASGQPVGFVIPTMIMVICSVLGLLMQCWTFYHSEVSEAELHEALVKECADPGRKRRLIKQAARQYRRKNRMTREQSEILATATIDEALATPPEEMKAYAALCGLPSEVEQVQLSAAIADEDGTL